jgi:transcription elongation factor GreA
VEEKRPELVDRLSFARTAGDLSENNDYTSAKQELELLDDRISELQQILVGHEVIKKNRSKAKSVCLGCRVLVQNGRNSQEFCIVGEWETDPTNKKISHTSPLGQALLGKCKGEKVEVAAPAGKIVYKILEIE